MKTKLRIAIFFIAITMNAQTTVDFESLTVPATGYFNGSTMYTGDGEQETIPYEEAAANFYVNYTDTGAYDYWSGFSYSNQTDLVTASYTNYSAYSQAGGGANGSANYVFTYTYGGDTMTFDTEVTVNSVQITNGVWAYHYMKGTDGSGTGTYEAGDYLDLTITGVKADGSLTTPIVFKLADFANGNTTIIDDWTTVDLSSLGTVKGLKFQLAALDSYTPYYFCMDDLVYTSTTAGVNENGFENSITVYPNPVKGTLNITAVAKAKIQVYDINGRLVRTKENCDQIERIDVQALKAGMYFVKIIKENKVTTKKIVIN